MGGSKETKEGKDMGYEWEKQRAELIDSREDLIIRCKLLEEENLLQQLYETVAASKNVDLLNEYAFLLADNYSQEILELYRNMLRTWRSRLETVADIVNLLDI